MENQLELFKGFTMPKTNIQEVLLTLILQEQVSLFDFPVMAGFRTRVSNLVLVYGLNLKTEKQQRINKFKNTYTYHTHILPKEEKEKAVEIYKKMTNEGV